MSNVINFHEAVAKLKAKRAKNQKPVFITQGDGNEASDLFWVPLGTFFSPEMLQEVANKLTCTLKPVHLRLVK